MFLIENTNHDCDADKFEIAIVNELCEINCFIPLVGMKKQQKMCFNKHFWFCSLNKNTDSKLHKNAMLSMQIPPVQVQTKRLPDQSLVRVASVNIQIIFTRIASLNFS